MRIRKKTRCIWLYAPEGYSWVGRRCLPDTEVWDERGRLLHKARTNNVRGFRTTRKAMNVLFSLPKGKGAELYREYWKKNGRLIAPYYNFNSREDVNNFDRRQDD